MTSETSFYQLGNDQPTTAQIQANKELFVKHFQEAIFQKIKKYTLEAEQLANLKIVDYFKIGLNLREEQKIGQKTKAFIEAIGWIPAIPGTDLIPGLHTGLSLMVKGTQVTARLGYAFTRKNKVNHYQDKLVSANINMVKSLMKEVGLEIARIFEFQIAVLNKDDIAKVAEHAGKRIIKVIAKDSSLCANGLNRNDMLEALIMAEPISSHGNGRLKTILLDENDKSKQVEWNLDSIFQKPGLRYEVDRNQGQHHLPTYEFYRLEDNSEEIRPDKYGYRNRIMAYKEDTSVFEEHRVDFALRNSPKSQRIVDNLDYYQPTTRIIGHREILGYLTNSDAQHKSLDQILTESYAFNSRAPEQAVYRDVPLGRVLKDAGIIKLERNLNGVDFIRVDFRGVEEINADFSHSLLLFANAEGKIKLTGSISETDLTFANLQGTNLEEVVMKGSILDFTDLRSATIGDNEDFLNARTDNAVIGEIGDDTTIINPILVADTFKALQSQILQGGQQLEELKLKYEKLEEMYKAVAKIEYRCNFDWPDRLYQRDSNLINLVLEKLELGRVALTGIFGSGKSYLAQSSLRIYLDTHPDSLIWRFDASSSDTLEESYRELAYNIGLKWDKKEKINSERISEITTKLANNDQIQKVILFFDNSNTLNYQALTNYIPGGLSKAMIIVTSQQRDFFVEEKNNIREEQIKFTPQEAMGFLANSKAIGDGVSQVSQADQIKYQELAQKFSYFPIGLAIAKDYMYNTGTTISEYYDLVSDQNIEQYIASSLEFQPLYIPLYNALRLSFTHLTPKSQTVLYQTVFLSGQAIPLLLLPDTEGVYRKVDASAFASNIKASSLAQVRGEDDNKVVVVHEFVQKNLKILMSAEQKQSAIESLLGKITKYFVKDTRFRCEEAELFAKSFADHKSILPSFNLNQLLLPHVETFLKNIDEIKERQSQTQDIGEDKLELSLEGQLNQIKLFNVLGYFYTQVGGGRIQESEYWLMRAKTEFEQITGLNVLLTENPSVQEKQIYDHLQNFALSHRDELASFYPKLGIEGRDWIGLEQLQKYYFTEFYVSILYSLGRTYFYDKGTYAPRIGEFKAHIQLAHDLSNVIEQETKNEQGKGIKILHQYLTESEGLLYFDKEDESNRKSVETTRTRYIELADDPNDYYEEGKLKKQPDTPYDKIRCYKQVISCSNILGDSDTAREYIGRLDEQLELQKQQGLKSERIADIYNQRGNYFLEVADEKSLEVAQESFLYAYNEEKAKLSQEVIGKVAYPLFEACIGLGRVELRQNNLKAAQQYFNEAKTIAEKLYLQGRPELNNLLDSIHSQQSFTPSSQTLTMATFAIKEMIEAGPMLKYFFKEILLPPVQYLTQQDLPKVTLPEFISNNYFWIGMHGTATIIGVSTLPTTVPTITTKIAASLTSTSIYGIKLITHDAFANYKQQILQTTEDKSMDNLREFIEKCGFDIISYTLLGTMSGGIGKLMISGMPLTYIAYDIAISATIGGSQCYVDYQIESLSTRSTATTEVIVPYILDGIVALSLSTVIGANMQFGTSNIATNILAIKQSLAIMSSVVATDYMSKLFLQINHETISNIEESYLKPAFDYLSEEVNNIMHNSYLCLVGGQGNNNEL